MKSGYYLATVINAYRRMMDGGEIETSQAELGNVAHREYTQAYALGANAETVNYADSQSKGEYTYIADVVACGDGFVTAQMRNRFKKGDVLEVLSPSAQFRQTFVVDEAYDSKGELSDDCKLVSELYKLRCAFPLQPGDFLRRKNGGV